MLLFCISVVVAVVIPFFTPSAACAETFVEREATDMAENPKTEQTTINADNIIFFIFTPHYYY